MKRFNWDVLQKFGEQYLTLRGVTQENSIKIADIAVKTEAMGVKTHGMAVFPYFELVIPDDLNPEAEPAVVNDFGATALIDGNSGFSQLSLILASQTAIEKAKKFGCAIINGRNCSWLGALGTYLMAIAEKGFLAQLWAQMSTCVDAAPLGGIDPRFSTNPIALAFPTPIGPSVFDASTTSISMGRVKQMVEEGEIAQESIFLDKNGNLSKNPHVVIDGGTILFLGGNYLGHKGYGFSLFNEAVAALSGGSCNNPKSKPRQCFSLVVINPDMYSGTDYFMQEIDRFIAHIKSSKLRNGYSEIRLPGERRLEKLRESTQEGIILNENMIDKLNTIALKYGITPLA